jgi:hypothetical protein
MHRILSALVLVLITTSSVLAQNLIVQTYKINEADKQYKKILIAGEGNIQGRMYLQNVTDELIKALAKKKINCDYKYLGDYRKIDTDEAFSAVDKSQYDAVIRFKPRKLEEELYVYDKTGPNPYDDFNLLAPANGMTAVTINDFDLSLTETNNTIWEGRVKTSIVASKANAYRKISSMITKELTKNKIIPAK